MLLKLFLAFRNIARAGVHLMMFPDIERASVHCEMVASHCNVLSSFLSSEIPHWLAFYNNCASYQLEALVSTCMEREDKWTYVTGQGEGPGFAGVGDGWEACTWVGLAS
uniref:Uncharacterized protein n=1 Tax=Micrurus lemniscatus lemniscatus TaxID=129467 RepID=A0A2D4IS71_MICLE